MNVLLIVERYPPHIGGTERLFETIATNLSARGHSVRVLTTSAPRCPRTEHRNGILIERVDPLINPQSLFSLAAIPEALRHARWADVIHASSYTGILPGAIAHRITKTPLLITAHEYRGRTWRSVLDPIRATLHRIAEEILYGFSSDRIVAVSNATRNALIASGTAPEHVVTIHNSFDTTAWNGPALESRTRELRKKLIGAEEQVIAVYGRPGPTKGIDVAIEAFRDIANRIPNARLVAVVGSTPRGRYGRIKRTLDSIEGAISRSDLCEHELAAYVNLADIVIVPSITEGFGYTVLEAATLGKPIVASRTGSIPEVIFGRYALVPPGDPHAIADAAINLIERPPPSRPPKRFRVSDMIDAYETEYARIMRTG